MKKMGNDQVSVNYLTEGSFHVIKFSIGKQNRKITFPTQESAMDFLQKINVYGRLRKEI